MKYFRCLARFVRKDRKNSLFHSIGNLVALVSPKTIRMMRFRTKMGRRKWTIWRSYLNVMREKGRNRRRWIYRPIWSSM